MKGQGEEEGGGMNEEREGKKEVVRVRKGRQDDIWKERKEKKTGKQLGRKRK